MYLETRFARSTNYTEEGKCESLACHLGAGSIAERWYDELEISTPEITNSWTTLRKYFHVKWLGAPPSILLEVPPPTFCTATTTPTANGRADASHHSPPTTTSSQPTNNAPTTSKLNPIMPRTTQTNIKPPANETKPETTVATTSDATIGTNTITGDGMDRRVNGEGRKEEEQIRTVFGDTKEEERGEEETGGEEEAKTQRRNEVRDKRVPARDDDGGEPRDVRSSPNEGEHEPQRLAFVESGDRASMPKEPEFDDDGDACGLEHLTNSIVEPQGPHKTPHDAPTPATNDVIRSASVSHPPTETTVHTEPPPSGITSDPDGTTHTSTTTTSGIRGPAHGPVFDHHALVDSP